MEQVMPCQRLQKERINIIIFLFLVFTFFMFFFSKLYPVVIFDTDDWYYSYLFRHSLPLWRAWNPTRVFAEVFMPMVSAMGAYVIYPITHDYLWSLTLSYAFSIAISMVALVYVLYCHFYRGKRGNLSQGTCLAILTFFLICHFLIFRTTESGNNYMLKSIDACTYFYYVIPNIMNCLFVVCLMNDDSFINYFDLKDSRYIKRAFSLLLLYFSVFSNIWASIILASYLASQLLINFFKSIRNKTFAIKSYFKENTYNVLVLGLWGVSQLFEFTGGRADSIKHYDFLTSLKKTLVNICGGGYISSTFSF